MTKLDEAIAKIKDQKDLPNDILDKINQKLEDLDFAVCRTHIGSYDFLFDVNEGIVVVYDKTPTAWYIPSINKTQTAYANAELYSKLGKYLPLDTKTMDNFKKAVFVLEHEDAFKTWRERL
jgi:hypothetical protein